MRSGFRVPDLSLRARLLLALIALAAVGLAALAFISYRELHTYLYDRVDQQLESAVRPVTFALVSELEPGRVPALERTLAPKDGSGTPLREFPNGGQAGPGGGGGGGGPPSQLPPGTYGQLREADGDVITEVAIGYEESEPLPELPTQLEAERLSSAEPITVGSTGGDGESFRAIAVASPGNTVTVVAVPLGDTQATLDRLALIELVVSGAILVGLALIAWWLVGVGLRPLRRMGDVAGEIAAGDLSRRVEPANERTEVGRLGLALNAMLTQIESLFAQREADERRLRRFLADASHELRTPLAAIRGYAELHRLGASREPEQVDRAMARIESESERMSGLVDDLLTLARIDEVRELEREPVRLDSLLADAREDTAAAWPEREVTLESREELTIEADPGQVRRVFDNLLRNAAVHTPPGSPIAITLAREGTDAVVRVRDRGPGLPEGDPEALFDRFWRSSSSRGRADGGGAGLGLAIVAAIVSAHGGSVEAADAPGGGAEFTVRLPLAAAPQTPA